MRRTNGEAMRYLIRAMHILIAFTAGLKETAAKINRQTDAADEAAPHTYETEEYLYDNRNPYPNR